MTANWYLHKDRDTGQIYVFAETTILPGTLIVKEAPLLDLVLECDLDDVLEDTQNFSVEARRGIDSIHAAVNALRDSEKTQLRALFPRLEVEPTPDPSLVPQSSSSRAVSGRRKRQTSRAHAMNDPSVMQKIRYNAFNDKNNEDEPVVRVYGDISMFNHSCKPNAHYYVHEGFGFVRATELIHTGTEITITYIASEGFKTAQERRAFYEEHYGFTCNCLACERQPRMSKEFRTWFEASNKGRTDIAALLDKLRPYAPEDVNEKPKKYTERLAAHHRDSGYEGKGHYLVADAGLLVHYIEEEQLKDSRLVEALYLQTFITYKYGSSDEAHKYAKKAMDAEAIAFEDSKLWATQYGTTFLRTVAHYRGDSG